MYSKAIFIAAVIPAPHQARLPVKGAIDPTYNGDLADFVCAGVKNKRKIWQSTHKIMTIHLKEKQFLKSVKPIRN